jgi:hypothetical protein
MAFLGYSPMRTWKRWRRNGRNDMSVKLCGSKLGWVVVVRGFGFVTASSLLTKAQAIRLAARIEFAAMRRG